MDNESLRSIVHYSLSIQTMWYFIIPQPELTTAQFQTFGQAAALTETESFNEPFDNLYIFAVERNQYSAFVDILDNEGVTYQATATKPTREELLDGLRGSNPDR